MIRKSIFVGMSNYRGASLKELCDEIARIRSVTIKDIEEFEKLREEILKLKNENLNLKDENIHLKGLLKHYLN